jgi:hypothetical protein
MIKNYEKFPFAELLGSDAQAAPRTDVALMRP